MTCTFSLTWGCTGGWGFSCCLHKTLQNLIITICKIAIHHLFTCKWTQSCASCKKYIKQSLSSIDIKNKSNYKYNLSAYLIILELTSHKTTVVKLYIFYDNTDICKHLKCPTNENYECVYILLSNYRICHK